MKIKIKKETIDESIEIIMNEKKNLILFNGEPVNYQVNRFIFKVCNMVSGWPHELKDLAISDGVKYDIIIKDKKESGEEVNSYSFRNDFPEDIYRLEMLINDVCSSLEKGE